MGVDYGTKRTGIAVTDPLQIIASGLKTVETPLLMDFFEEYLQLEVVETVVFGEPLHKDGKPNHFNQQIYDFTKRLKKKYPRLNIVFWDERFTSVAAKQVILQSGAKKKKRRDKALVDTVSAALILKDYMETEVWK